MPSGCCNRARATRSTALAAVRSSHALGVPRRPFSPSVHTQLRNSGIQLTPRRTHACRPIQRTEAPATLPCPAHRLPPLLHRNRYISRNLSPDAKTSHQPFINPIQVFFGQLPVNTLYSPLIDRADLVDQHKRSFRQPSRPRAQRRVEYSFPWSPRHRYHAHESKTLVAGYRRIAYNHTRPHTSCS